MRIEAGLQDGAMPPPFSEGTDGRRQTHHDRQPSSTQPCDWEMWAVQGCVSGEAQGPHSPPEMHGEVCTTSTQTLPGSSPALGNFHSHELTNSTYKSLIKTIREAVWRPPHGPLSATALWNHRKSLAVSAKNCWVPANYSHLMYSELFLLWFIYVFHRFICDTDLCSFQCSAMPGLKASSVSYHSLSNTVACNKVIKPWNYTCSLINTGAVPTHTFERWFWTWSLRCWNALACEYLRQEKSVHLMVARVIPRQV